MACRAHLMELVEDPETRYMKMLCDLRWILFKRESFCLPIPGFCCVLCVKSCLLNKAWELRRVDPACLLCSLLPGRAILALHGALCSEGPRTWCIALLPLLRNS